MHSRCAIGADTSKLYRINLSLRQYNRFLFAFWYPYNIIQITIYLMRFVNRVNVVPNCEK